MSALEVVCEQRDPGGDVCRVEVDPRDGRAYLTVIAYGVEAPFELTPETAGRIAAALRVYAAPIDMSGLRFTNPAGETAQRVLAAVKTASACVPCGGAGRPGGWPCGGCG